MEKIVKLKPIKEDISYYDEIEKKIKRLFKTEFYYPLLKILESKYALQNALSNNYLKRAILSDRIHYSNGKFSGKFNSLVSKELKALGAVWDAKTSTYSIELKDLPFDIRGDISLAKVRFDENLKEIDKRLSNIDPQKFSDQLDISKNFDETLSEVQTEFEQSVRNITVVPELTKYQRRKIADEWQNNMRLYIKKFTEEQIIDLRKSVHENVFELGNRREVLVNKFMDSYDITERKAKFLARQETNLLMAKFKETKYVDAGVPEYEWRCVHMPHQLSPKSVYKPGEVRYSHGILEGKIFSWKDPPVTTAPGQPQRKNNPGQDYNCRCFALPIVRFKK